VSSVELTTLPGTTVELRAADTRGAAAADYRCLAEGTATGPALTLAPPDGTTGRWYLLWITGLAGGRRRLRLAGRRAAPCSAT
jgi:hypothetical protein